MVAIVSVGEVVPLHALTQQKVMHFSRNLFF